MDIASFLLYCVVVTFTPGPTNIMILSITHNFGHKKAKEFAYGATVAFGLLLSISAVFNTALMTIMPNILPLAQVVGSIYILYLAVHIWKSGSTNSMNSNNAKVRWIDKG